MVFTLDNSTWLLVIRGKVLGCQAVSKMWSEIKLIMLLFDNALFGIYWCLIQPLTETHAGHVSAKQDWTFWCGLKHMPLAEWESIDLRMHVLWCDKLSFTMWEAIVDLFDDRKHYLNVANRMSVWVYSAWSSVLKIPWMLSDPGHAGQDTRCRQCHASYYPICWPAAYFQFSIANGKLLFRFIWQCYWKYVLSLELLHSHFGTDHWYRKQCYYLAVIVMHITCSFFQFSITSGCSFSSSNIVWLHR